MYIYIYIYIYNFSYPSHDNKFHVFVEIFVLKIESFFIYTTNSMSGNPLALWRTFWTGISK